MIASAFDSAGQRCSALRVLCLQEDVADRILAMLKGALHELTIARTDTLSADIGPVITAEAKGNIEAHIEAMRKLGRKVEQIELGDNASAGTFVAPTIIELPSLADLSKEVFGPVLHVIRYRRADLDKLIDQINGTGYGLTFGLHTRLDETIAHVTSRVKAGNLYVNRNVIGAVVGVQPFGGRGLSGTGPKAGGPLYLGRLVSVQPEPPQLSSVHRDEATADFARFLDESGEGDAAEVVRTLASTSALGLEQELPGPVGERNLYGLHPRGRILLLPQTKGGLFWQLGAALATGNTVVIDEESGLRDVLAKLPASVAARVNWARDWAQQGPFAGALVEGDGERLKALNTAIAEMPGPLVLVQSATTEALIADPQAYCLNWLLEEVSISTNTAAAGGNASLMSIG